MKLLRRASQVLVILIALIPGVGLYIIAKNFAVAQPGNAAAYWEYLCGVQLPSFNGHDDFDFGGTGTPNAELLPKVEDKTDGR